VKNVFGLRGLVLAASEKAAWRVGKGVQIYTFLVSDVGCFFCTLSL